MMRRTASVAAAALAASSSTALGAAERVWFTVGGYEVRDDDLWVAATAVLCCLSCAVLGCYLVLRRMSLLGDAITHAILPGLAAAFLLSGTRDIAAMLGGAMVVGVLTALLSAGLNRWGRVPEDAAMGVVFTTLFALGVVLISWAARDVDLDPGCVLYGLIEFTPFDTVRVRGAELPRAFVQLAVALVVNLGLVALFYKELKIVCFDPFLATTMGISAAAVHYGLMTAVAATAVVSFESVGSILVVAMLVGPGATAHLLTDRLSRMLVIAGAIGALSAVLGYVLAVAFNTSVAGMIASVSLGLFVLAVIGAPRHGLLGAALRRSALSIRIHREDVLGLLYRWHEHARSEPRARALTPRDVGEATRSGVLGRFALALLRVQGLVESPDGRSLGLTQLGMARARAVVRAHRLWETFIVRHLDTRPARVHEAAHDTEHFLSGDLQERLTREVDAEHDPHGKPIPPRDPRGEP